MNRLQDIKKILSTLTAKKRVWLTKRGNDSIKIALEYCRDKGFSKVFLQDQGAWLTYPQFAKKLGIGIEMIKTDYGLVDGFFKNGILLINTMPGYAFLQDTGRIKTDKENYIVINDVSGSIGHSQAKWGEIAIGSFGPNKAIDLGKLGFIAADADLGINDYEISDEEIKSLKEKLSKLAERIEHLSEITVKIKRDLKKYNIIHPELPGINVIIKTGNDNDKMAIIKYCEQNKYEYTLCPRYIRINEEGVSIEVKRL